MTNTKRKLLSQGSLLSFLSTSLKGISQVILIENAVTGFIILIAITSASYIAGIIALLSAMIGTLVARWGGADSQTVNQGLFGYNSVLTGIALTLYLSGPYDWVVALVGAAAAAILTAAMMHFIAQTEIPILTFPFVVLTWFILLSSYRLNIFELSNDLVPQDLSRWTLDITGEVNWLDGSLAGIGQVFFLEKHLPGLLIFIAVFWASWKLGLYAVLGNVAAVLTSYWLGGEHSLIFSGLYGYNAILTIIAVSKVFNTDHHRFAPLSGLIAACLTVPVMASLSTWLLPYGLPALTMPFVLCTWLLLGARKVMPRL